MDERQYQKRRLGSFIFRFSEMNYPGFLDFNKKWIGATREWSPSTLQMDICNVEAFLHVKGSPLRLSGVK